MGSYIRCMNPAPNSIHMTRRHLLTLTALGAGASSITVLSGCGSGAQRGAKDAAQKLANGLQAADATDVPLTPAPTDPSAFFSLRMVGEMRPRVTVANVDVQDTKATANLKFDWDSLDPDQIWSYTSSADLAQDDSGAWNVQWSDAIVHPDLQDGQGLALELIPGERSGILGNDDVPIVSNQEVHVLGINKADLSPEDAETSARELAEVVDIPVQEYQEKVHAYGDEAFVEAITLRRSDFLKLDGRRAGAIDGYEVQTRTMPLAVTKGFAGALIGSVRTPTAEDLETAGDELDGVDWIGSGGLQEAFDDRLRAVNRLRVTVSQLDGARTPPRLEALWEQSAAPDSPLRTTLDVPLQRAAEEIIANTDSPSALVAVRVSTGDVLVAACGPDDNAYPTATLGQYAPGSTFKIATSLALLRKGLTEDSTVHCTENISVDGRSFNNAGTYLSDHLGDISLKEAIAQSCNTALIDRHEEVSQDDLADAGAALGIGAEWDLGIPAYSGNIPRDETGTEHAASMIGQGKVQTSPLAMAIFAASVAAGETVTPQLLPEDKPAKSVSTDFTSAEAAQLRSLMRAVVTEGHLQDLDAHPGGEVIGKTGTAEFGEADPDRGGFPRTHSWVIAAQADLAFSVFVEDGDYGSVTGAPLAKKFLDAVQSVGQTSSGA